MSRAPGNGEIGEEIRVRSNGSHSLLAERTHRDYSEEQADLKSDERQSHWRNAGFWIGSNKESGRISQKAFGLLKLMMGISRSPTVRRHEDLIQQHHRCDRVSSSALSVHVVACLKSGADGLIRISRLTA